VPTMVESSNGSQQDDKAFMHRQDELVHKYCMEVSVDDSCHDGVVIRFFAQLTVFLNATLSLWVP